MGYKPDDIVIDVGASYGSYTLSALQAGARYVVAVEPGEDEFCVLNNNLMINGWLGKCMAFNGVLGQTISPVTFHPDTHSLIVRGKKSESRLCLTLDFIAISMDVGKIDWVKSDVEGAELSVIEGALESIEKYHPKLFIEHHTEWVPESEQKIREILTSLGYKETKADRESSNSRWILWEHANV